MEWSREKTLEFIAAYRTYKILWDSSEEDYKNRIKRHEALEELAKQFGTLSTEVERKIKNLQSHFLRERKRHLMNKNGTTTWFAYKPLSFLLNRNKVETRPRVRKTLPMAPPKLVPVTSPNITPQRTQQVVQNTETGSAMKEILNWFKERDEFDLYGEQVAIKLRNISSPLARVTVQNKMNMLLVQAQMGVFDMPNEFVDTSNMDFCPIAKVEPESTP